MPNDFDDLSDLLSPRGQRAVNDVRNKIEQDLFALGARVSSRVLRDTEKHLDASLKEIIERSLRSALRSFERQQAALEADALSRATGLSGNVSRFIGDVTQTALLKVFSGGTHTSTRSRETAESKDAAEDFRASRAQAQSQLAEAVIRGQRNL